MMTMSAGRLIGVRSACVGMVPFLVKIDKSTLEFKIKRGLVGTKRLYPLGRVHPG